MIQGELALENNLIKQLNSIGYSSVDIKAEESLLSNLKTQIEKRKETSLSATEFDRIVNVLNKGTVFERAKTLRAQHRIERDNGDSFYFDFIDKDNYSNNIFQVTNQITIDGKYQNRYDVTLLINGLPLVQIELKRRGVDRNDITALRAAFQSLAQGDGTFQDRARKLGEETTSEYVDAIVNFILGASDRSFLTPGDFGNG